MSARSALLVAATMRAVTTAWAVHAAEPTRRYVYVFPMGAERCPAPHPPDEIVVCSHAGEDERYRIPPRLRAEREERHPARSLASQERSLEDVTRFTRPDSCSPVGIAGQTGCTQMMIDLWFQERQALGEEREAPR